MHDLPCMFCGEPVGDEFLVDVRGGVAHRACTGIDHARGERRAMFVRDLLLYALLMGAAFVALGVAWLSREVLFENFAGLGVHMLRLMQ